jgi:hypothetical protein
MGELRQGRDQRNIRPGQFFRGTRENTLILCSFFQKVLQPCQKLKSQKVCKKYKEEVQLLIIYGTTVSVHLGGSQSSCPLQRMRSGSRK